MMVTTGISISACEKSEISYNRELRISKRVWNEFKALSDNSYAYTIIGSSWTGIVWETTILIDKGKIVERAFRITSTNGLSDDIPEDQREWVESGDKIGSHIYSAAAKPLTIDDIYYKAETDWLVKRKNTKTYFEVDDIGLVACCGYVSDDCLDDCFFGIRIAKIAMHE